MVGLLLFVAQLDLANSSKQSATAKVLTIMRNEAEVLLLGCRIALEDTVSCLLECNKQSSQFTGRVHSTDTHVFFGIKWVSLSLLRNLRYPATTVNEGRGWYSGEL